jgi:hypothetical protein
MSGFIEIRTALLKVFSIVRGTYGCRRSQIMAVESLHISRLLRRVYKTVFDTSDSWDV